MFFSLNAMESMGPIERLALVCIPIVLLLIAMLMPRKNKVLSVIVRVPMILLIVAVAAFRLFPKLGELTGVSALTGLATRDSFIPVVMLLFALFLLWGLFFPHAYLTQGLYGLVCSVPLAAGLLGFIFPTWLNVSAFTDIFTSVPTLFTLAEYCALVFVPLYLVVSGLYRVRLSSFWHALFGMAFLGSLLLTLVQANLITTPAYDSIAGIVFDLKTLTFGAEGLKACGIFAGTAVGIALLFGILATIGRLAFSRTGEKLMSSETRGAFFTRLIGRIVSGVGSLVLLIITPELISLMGLTGTVATLFCLIPIALILLVQLFVEFAAEDMEIKRAQIAYAEA